MRLTSVLAVACCITLAAGASSQVQPKQVPPPIYPPALYQMNDVGKTLNLTPDQINRLNTVTQQTQAQMLADFNKVNALSDAQRFARVQELNRQYYGTWQKSANDIFNEQQRTRYQQLNYQYGGFNTLYDPEVQTRLTLTPAQVQSLRDKVDWSNQQMQSINAAGAIDPAKGTQLYNEYWKQRQERLNTFLTPEQQRAWREITGEPYIFQPTFPPR